MRGSISNEWLDIATSILDYSLRSYSCIQTPTAGSSDKDKCRRLVLHPEGFIS